MWQDIEVAAWLNRNLGMSVKPWEVAFIPVIWLDAIFEGTRIKGRLRELGQLKNG